jgi:hypothetical protein
MHNSKNKEVQLSMPFETYFNGFVSESVREIISAQQANPSLPNWPDQKRALPNEILRSALFNARNHKQPRRFIRDEEIPAIGNILIRYRGEELRQDDELVFMHVMHLGKQQPLGKQIEFSPYSFVKCIGWPVKGDSYERLKKCLRRMSGTAVSFESDRLGLCVSLIRKFGWQDEESGTVLHRWRVWIEPEMQVIFNENYLTWIDFEVRKVLPSGIASKLHGYWLSHKKPYPIRIETLMKICGTEMTIRHFREQLKKAMQSLVASGILVTWEITYDGLVSVKRKR